MVCMTTNTTLYKPLSKLAIYDNGGETVDRYTVVYLDIPERNSRLFPCVGMSENPFHPQGIGQHSTAMPGNHLGKKITWKDLPQDCQKVVLQDLGL